MKLQFKHGQFLIKVHFNTPLSTDDPTADNPATRPDVDIVIEDMIDL
ncbi:MAG: hypothetical protein AAF146_20110 [Bacteroidota bacterium]